MIDNAKQLNDVQKIIVLDYGSQYNQLIARRIREFGVFSELKSHKISAQEVKDINPIGIVLSGGPNSVYADNAFGIDPEIFELGIPILGICYGMQLLTSKLGGKVVPASEAGNSEYGQSTLRVKTDSKLFKGTPKEQTVLMSHGDAVTEIPESFHLVGDSTVSSSTQKCVIQSLVMISCITLPLTFVEQKVIGQWRTSLTCKSLLFAKK